MLRFYDIMIHIVWVYKENIVGNCHWADKTDIKTCINGSFVGSLVGLIRLEWVYTKNS